MTVTATETIRKEIFVDASPETAFRVFTEQIATWWPLHTHGIYLEERDTVNFEDREGWKLIERAHDGRENVWAEVLEYEFASRLRMTWHPGRTAEEMPTEVELTFTADGEGTTVVLEHSGWERCNEERRAVRANYDSGWNPVLGRYKAAV